MDLPSGCKDKLARFRIKELKDVLTQLGLPKQGKKQDLVDRILALFSDDQGLKSSGWSKKYAIGKAAVAKIIDDTYRKMQVPSATDLASRNHGNLDIDNSMSPEDKAESYQEMKVRCPCGSSLINDSMIKCEDPKCQVWQHINCVIIPENPTDGIRPEIPQTFYCELCRISRADPFWVTTGHPLFPVKMAPSHITGDGTVTAQTTERTFQLSRTDRELLQRPDFDLQVWCILPNDKVSFRMQWPQYAELLVNNVPIRTTNRPGSQQLGINGRDDGPVITTCSREGTNKIILSRTDDRMFTFGVRIARRRTVQQVLSLIPNESAGECLEDALARVRRCIGGGAKAENADSDSDLEVVADSVTVNLRCPMSGLRMRIAGRFKPCVHMGCFDLETFVQLNQRSRKWQCPICLKNYTLENVIIDPYFNRITTLLINCGEDVTEINVKPDGSWRAKEHELGCWHLPDGSLAALPKTEVKAEPDILDQMKQGISDGHTGLKLGIKRNRNGVWEVSKPDEIRAQSSSSQFDEKYGNPGSNIIMSSSASGSRRDGEDVSVNQDAGHFDFSANKSHEFESAHHGIDHAHAAGEKIPGQGEADVIVLSDSEDDNDTLAPLNTAYNNQDTVNNGIPFITRPGAPESYPEDAGIGTSGTPFLGLFGDGDEFGISPLWSLPQCSQPGSGFQLPNNEACVPDNFLDVQQNPLDCSNGNNYGLAPGSLGDPPSHAEDVPSYRTGTDINGGLVDNPMASEEDPSLQIFLPTRPTGVEIQANMNEHTATPNGSRTDDWISLRLGGAGMNLGDASYAGETDARSGQHQSNGIQREPLDDAAALLLSMNHDRPNKDASNSQRSESPFSVHRQPRSVKPRLYLSIDSDSD